MKNRIIAVGICALMLLVTLPVISTTGDILDQDGAYATMNGSVSVYGNKYVGQTFKPYYSVNLTYVDLGAITIQGTPPMYEVGIYDFDAQQWLKIVEDYTFSSALPETWGVNIIYFNLTLKAEREYGVMIAAKDDAGDSGNCIIWWGYDSNIPDIYTRGMSIYSPDGGANWYHPVPTTFIGDVYDFVFRTYVEDELRFYAFPEGMHFFVPPANIALTAYDIADAFGSECKYVGRFNSDTQQFEFFEKSNPTVNNFSIEQGKGYFAYFTSESAKTLVLQGAKIYEANVTLKKGWNSIGWLNSTINAESLAQNITNCTAIAYWDNTLGRFITHPAGTDISNFTVEKGEGYFVYVTTDETLII